MTGVSDRWVRPSALSKTQFAAVRRVGKARSAVPTRTNQETDSDVGTLHFADPGRYAASAARIRAQLRVPLWKLFKSYFSFGE